MVYIVERLVLQTIYAGIYILKKIRNYTKTKIQNGETLPKLNIGIYAKSGQYYRRHNHVCFLLYHTIFNPYLELDFQNDAGTFFTFVLECS